MALGGPFEQGLLIKPHVYDVLPTIVTLLGLPISKELEGRIIRNAFPSGWFTEHRVVRVPTYGPRGSVIAVDAPSSDDSHVDRLRGLGYVE